MDEFHVDKERSLDEGPFETIERNVKKLRNKRDAIVKVDGMLDVELSSFGKVKMFWGPNIRNCFSFSLFWNFGTKFF
jgi:hypothetical protein